MQRQRDNLSLTDRELLYRLSWFTRIRWGMGLFIVFLLLASWYLVGLRFLSADGSSTLAPAVNVVLLIFLYNAAFTFLIHVFVNRRGITRRILVALALAQIILDMVAICAVVHFSGGIENYFIILILVPLVIATELLPRSLAYVAAAVATLLLHAMAWAEQQGIIQHVPVVWSGEGGSISPPVFSHL